MIKNVHFPILWIITKIWIIIIPLHHQALEANNKYIRHFAEFRARKTSSEDQLYDVLSRLLERSHPEVAAKKLAHISRRQPCERCASITHTTKKHDAVAELNDYDDIIVFSVIGKQIWAVKKKYILNMNNQH